MTELREEPLPSPGQHEVLIRVHAVSLNYRDAVLLRGDFPVNSKEEVIPVSDGAGEVIAVGPGVKRVKPNDRVAVGCFTTWIGGPFIPEYFRTSAGFSIDGMLAEYVLFHEDALVYIPDYMSYAEAASLPCAAPLQPGQTVLIQGTGGVSLFALQITKIYGARVLAITSSDTKAARLKALGADAVVNYNTSPDWNREILTLTDGKGVDRTLDIAGEKTIQKAAACTKIGGVIILIGFASGLGGGIPPIDIMARTLTLTGSIIGSRLDFEAMLAAMARHELRPVIDQVYPFAEYKEAYQRLESGQQVGKVVIEIVNQTAD
ncbi:alcohol dehydrogenase [Aspergillus niger ATCC 1015]|uniref:Alcohol dehydrogenase n=1 Tax=Aspergillus niger (strain ATCC 1015 / CBS 113.46 / FGSC A1144 / LSHB Ac4 / NCTC 3858a / NRRL 328 / USDA 3528.7) TaxID=380704 RepID=G3XPB8_ASPNA|nr:alcohol dehydrogenase [Aspergillus niger ATCC 1015]